MQTLKIEATPRADFGKKASRAIRREGQVPASSTEAARPYRSA